MGRSGVVDACKKGEGDKVGCALQTRTLIVTLLYQCVYHRAFLVHKQIKVQLMQINLFYYKVPPTCFGQRRPSSWCSVTEYQFSRVWSFV